MVGMYFVNRDKIEEILLFMEKQLSLLEETDKWETPIEKAALERVCHTIIEGILDVGNLMIDGFIMRDPGSYEDIIDILNDEKVIPDQMSESFKIIVNYRKEIVRGYTSIEHNKMLQTFLTQKEIIKEFGPKVREYLMNELGAVTAFKPS
jgi:uncharacterized protein YutE (UPF0331/DUF86 family)